MQLRIENTAVFWALIPLFLFALYLFWRKRKNPLSFSAKEVWLRLSILILCLVGLSRPQMGNQVTLPSTGRANLILAIDISRSMIAEDVNPSRLGFASLFSQRLLAQLPNPRVALYAFTLDGYLLLPLTSDTNVVKDTLQSLSPSMVSTQGTDLTRMLDGLYQKLTQMEFQAVSRGETWTTPQILVLSDGESHRELNRSVLDKFASKKIPIHTLGIGTEAGADIPIERRYEGSELTLPRTASRFVKTQFHKETLQQISERTGGDYFYGRFDVLSSAAKRLSQSLELGKLQTSFKVKNEFFPWFFGAALFLCVIQMLQHRWQYLLRSLLFLFLLTPSQKAHANPLFETYEKEKKAIESYNQGLKALKEGNLRKATEDLEDASVNSPDPEIKKKALFNLGGAILRGGDPAQALQIYQNARDLPLADKKAEKEINQRISDNMVLAAKVKKQQEEQEQKQKQGSGEDGKDQKQAKDPNGPQQFQKQALSDNQKKKIWDMVSNEENQTQQRLREQRRAKTPEDNDKPW